VTFVPTSLGDLNTALCFLADANGVPLLSPQLTGAPTGEQDGSTADRLSLSDMQAWPHQFSGEFSSYLFYYVWSFVQLDALGELGADFHDPFISFFSVNARQALAIQEQGATAAGQLNTTFRSGRSLTSVMAYGRSELRRE
jgi:hypothetical protein